jgi:hypothetical protein
VSIEARQRGQCPALDLHNRDAQVRGMENELLERLAPLGNDEQANRLAVGDERLFHRVPAGNELLVRSDEIARRRPRGLSCPWRAGRATRSKGPAIVEAARPRPEVRAEGRSRRSRRPNECSSLVLDRLGVRRFGWTYDLSHVLGLGHRRLSIYLVNTFLPLPGRGALGRAVAETEAGTTRPGACAETRACGGWAAAARAGKSARPCVWPRRRPVVACLFSRQVAVLVLPWALTHAWAFTEWMPGREPWTRAVAGTRAVAWTRAAKPRAGPCGATLWSRRLGSPRGVGLPLSPGRARRAALVVRSAAI